MSSALSCVICHDCNRALRFFHVPSDPDRLQQWSNVLNFEITPCSIVCEKHFLEEHFTKNSELNCWRINSKAIPTLHLATDEDDDVKLINEEDFDTKFEIGRSDGHQKRNQAEVAQANVFCLWCDASFPPTNLDKILQHLKTKHYDDVLAYFGLEKDEILPPNVAADGENVHFEEDTMDLQVKDEVEFAEESRNFNEIAMVENDTMLENSSTQFSEFANEAADNYSDDSENDEMAIEQCNLRNDYAMQSDDSIGNEPDVNVDDIFDDGAEVPPEAEYESDTEIIINIEETEPAVMFDIIDLLRSIPTIWFLNCFKSKEFEAGLTNFCTQFSEKYHCTLTEIELHERLIDIRDWYIQIYDEQTSDQLLYPQSEYFWKLAEFLPDKPNGKTCDLCQLLFHDHIQYFAHKKLQHTNANCDNESQIREQYGKHAVEYLIKHAHDYYYARYPKRQGGFSYDCQICFKRIDKFGKFTFFEHIKTHLDIRDYVCDICGKAFVKFEYFQVHKNRHLGTHRFECKICGRNNFTNGSLLTAHRKRYHRPIEGSIEEIQAQFYSKKRFRETPGISFTIGADNKKTYFCKVCGKTYQHSSGIYKHRRVFHPEIKTLQRNYTKHKNKANKYKSDNYDSDIVDENIDTDESLIVGTEVVI